ncbi:MULTISPECIES: alpha/beta fold hydrolase [unclassified Sphingomonas]|uniref:alpha/beta fold hydrolase n=1 Tax=unclassified Sphingomonas TaxID=196159 RepID=UPI0006F99550|nr:MULTISPECIES: alpha/beta hydrolase [unclassified Sphingomonas]KQM66579.1 arylesterase [Sphingomonas sp. Leaf16]KQN16702.1 arylesterase [Sphingomonas sp. Leaf29]KQN23390.1 arylesterase [Sphingomonas sp. Leaf32]
MPYVKTRDGTSLFVKDWGQGRPVVLIHGWPLSADSWDPQAMALADAGYRVIAYDRRGFGRSDQPWSGYDYDTLSDDLADVLKETGVTDDIALVGFSMGGGEVARYMSRHHGKGVTRAGFIGSVVPYMLQTDDNPDGVPQDQLQEIADNIKADRPKFFRTFFDQFYGVGFITSPVSEEVLDLSWNTAMLAGLKPTLACAESFGTTDFRPDIPSITVPTLVIHGTADQTVPIDATGRALAKALPNATLIEYDGAPHGLFATESDRLTEDLLTFLGR